jgi:HEPN domain-containing protein
VTKRSRRKNVDQEEIFLHAVSFHLAFQVLHEWKPPHPSGMRALYRPASVLSAFTSELFLKVLICIETGHVPDGHHLLSLFNRLSVPTRKRIEELWDAYAIKYADKWIEIELGLGMPVARDLQTALKLASKTFELARYYYERREEFQFYLGALPDMLKLVVFELRPDWASRAEAHWKELHDLD